ncbi:MAG TPA: hypothetical protein VN694_08865 [Caulobacteraceae bacterium]|nr:hypothetical protein [Caulobacteraceae bacterium]
MRWVVVAGVLVLCGCSPKPDDTDIIARIKSPDGTLEALYADDVGGGAAVGTTQEVFVVKSGEAFPALTERVFSAECAHEIALAWEGPKTLRVSYQMAPNVSEGPGLRPSLSSIFSSGYWIYSDPHGVQVHFARSATPDNGGC